MINRNGCVCIIENNCCIDYYFQIFIVSMYFVIFISLNEIFLYLKKRMFVYNMLKKGL